MKPFRILVLPIFFIACQKNTTTQESSTKGNLSLRDTLCYEQKLEKDLTTLQMFIQGDSIHGKYSIQPFEKDGAIGTVKGIRKGSTMTLLYTYVIEGATQIEETQWKIEGEKVIRKWGEIEDKNGVLVLKYPEKAIFNDTLSKVSCQ